MKKKIIHEIKIDLSSRPIVMITEDLIQNQADQVLGRLLCKEEMDILRYGGFWNNDVARQIVLSAIEVAIKDVEKQGPWQ